MHEVDSDYMGVPPADVPAWRKATRERLLAARLALPAAQRANHDARIAAILTAELGALDGQVVAAYWPFRAEPDLRAWLGLLQDLGAQVALPVVVARAAPLEFRAWAPGTPLERGVWNIPVPAAGAAVVTPDIVIAPVVGFDVACYRLGYGGGFYDRTLAALAVRPRCIGVGYALAALPTIHPQVYDIALDGIVTECGLHRRGA